MKKTILEIYALAVCFTAVVCSTVTLGFGMWSLLEITAPEFTVSRYTYSQYEDNESFRSQDWHCGNAAAAVTAAAAAADTAAVAADAATADTGNKNPGCSERSEAEMTAAREKAWARELREERRDGMQTLVRCLLVLLVNLIVFLPHWLLAKRARATSTA